MTITETALELGRQLASTAEPSGPGLTWHADIMIGSDGLKPVIGHGDIGPTLYDGTAGVAVALAAVPELAGAARGAALHALSAAEELIETQRLGLFDGAAGIAWGAATAGRAIGDAGLAERGLALATAVEARLDPGDDAPLDVISGVAGTMLALQALAATSPEAAARHLVATARPQLWGAAWVLPGDTDPPLLGLGHGAAGIALALAEHVALTGDAGARSTYAAALEYERGWFDPDRVAWPDLRNATPGTDPAGWMAAWCHGAVGIGISRLRIAHLTGEPLAVAEASAALQAARDLVVLAGTALRSGETSDCTACHGLAGVAELLLLAERALGVPDHGRAARRVAGLLLEQREAAGGAWPCGLPGAGEIPGLMTGTAGILLTLLRASEATAIPTPLLPGPSGW